MLDRVEDEFVERGSSGTTERYCRGGEWPTDAAAATIATSRAGARGRRVVTSGCHGSRA